MKKSVLLFALFIYCGLISAQNKSFNLGMEIRPRFLLDNGYKTPKSINEKSYSYVTQRTRLNAGYERNKLQSYVSIQDVRFWGGDNKYKESGVFGNTESLSLHQAWFAFNPNKTISLKIGRQLLKYDDQRIISSRNWNDYQLTYDAVLFVFKDNNKQLDIGITWNSQSNNSLIYPHQKYKFFDFIRFQHQLNNFNISVIALLTGNTINDTSNNIYLRATYGANLKYNNNGLKIRSSFYYQNNLNNNGSNVSAFCFSLFAQQNLLQQKLNIGIGLDYLSGNNETNINTNKRFDILYGKRHGYYGYMDFFSNTPKQGLQDYMIKAEYKLNKKLSLGTDIHHFSLAQNIFDLNNPNSKLNKSLGQEFDFTLNWKIIDEASLQAGYSFFLITNSLKQIMKLNNEELKFPQFAYLMITVKPMLFH
jgi:hypothetical protein